ncbi:hypothetical protein HPB50_008659 [Hyalomma asiaticum]|uniref:Uncharacterized protein n=1 Tax=Hyalomma asiaticum TaxID=266040 RepID=A0ACB7S551_HYAAI|nr:hypothetical protein HPB50_008659 [Hyalomma asiaticum]
MLLLLSAMVTRGEASRACNACGPECVTACGTAMFRACCFNYNRKRSGPRRERLRVGNPGHGGIRRRVGEPRFDRQRHLRESRRNGRWRCRQRNSTGRLGAVLDAARAAAASCAVLDGAL